MLRVIYIIFAVLGASACISHPVMQVAELDHNQFDGYQNVEIIVEREVFALSDEAKAFAVQYGTMGRNDADKAENLLAGLFAANKLNLNYKAHANLTATQTFDAGVANCISLTILAHAMFKYIGIDSVIQDVEIPEYWTVRDREILINGHVNLQVRPKFNSAEPFNDTRAQGLMIDFDPQANASTFKTKELKQRELVSLFYNNIAAEHLLAKRNLQAYAYLKAALTTNKRNKSAWLNIGVLYSRVNLLDQAQRAFKQAMQVESNNYVAMESLAHLLHRQGDTSQADSILADLHIKRSKNPYYHIMLGDKALKASNAKLALKHFQQALALNKNDHLAYFAIARAQSALGNREATQKALELAKRNSKEEKMTQIYARKLSLLTPSIDAHSKGM